MDEVKIANILGNALGTGAATAVVLIILWKVLAAIAERWIKALDNVTATLTDHTTKDLAHHAEVKEAVVRVDAKLDAALEFAQPVKTRRLKKRKD